MTEKEIMYPLRIANEQWISSSASLEKNYVYNSPTGGCVAYVDSLGQGHMGYFDIRMPNVLTSITDLGTAMDVSVAYDARWRLTGQNKYTMYTVGEPYVCWVTIAGDLVIRQGTTGPIVRLDSGVTKCTLVRGWKHITDSTIDQGLTVFYLKGGLLYSRSYVQLDSTTYQWQMSETYSTPGGILDIDAFRTSDYRIAIVCKYTSESKMLVTNRTFPGQAIQSEYIQISNDCSIDLKITQVEKHTVKVDTGHILYKNGSSISKVFAHNYANINTYAKNPSGECILLSINTIIPTDQFAAFANSVRIKDSTGIPYSVNTVSYQGTYLKLEMTDFNNAVGDMTISYTSGVKDALGKAMPEFSCTFTPVGLVPTAPDPPVVVSIQNVNSEVVS